MPDGLFLKPDETSGSYFEDEAGTLGLYVRAYELSEAKPSADQPAEYIQHDYGYEDHRATQSRFSSLERSIVRVTGSD